MRKILNFAIIASVLILGACSKQLPFEANPTPTPSGRTLSLTASMPTTQPETRYALERDDKDIKLTWTLNEEMDVAFVQGGTTKGKITIAVSGISSDAKVATFPIAVPNTVDQTQPFDIYGVTGGRGIDITGANPRAALPNRAYMSTPSAFLSDIETNQDVMLHFSLKDIQPSQLEGSVQFKHLGSIFAIHLTNNSAAFNYMKGVELAGQDPANSHWAFNSYYPGQHYNLITGNFLNDFNYGDVPGDLSQTYDNWLHFKKDNRFELHNGSTMIFWCWYPASRGIVENNELVANMADLQGLKAWPSLKLRIKSGSLISNTEIEGNTKTSRNTRVAKTPVAGKTYHFYAKWDGNLNFTNSAGVNL